MMNDGALPPKKTKALIAPLMFQVQELFQKIADIQSKAEAINSLVEEI